MTVSHSEIGVEDALDAAEYYAEELATYYIESPGMAPARVQGDPVLLAAMGLSPDRPPVVEEVERFIKGESIDGKPLRPGKPGKKNIGAHDFTFSAPKSVSVAWAIGNASTKRALAAAHARAVDRALEMLQKEAGFASLGKKGEIAARLAIARFPQADSRPVNGLAPDPDLHDHCLVSQTTLCVDGKFRAMDTMRLHGLFNKLNGLYLRGLGRNLKAEGFELAEGLHAVELASVDRETIEHFSKRSSVLEDAGRKEAAVRGLDWVRMSRKERSALIQQVKYASRDVKNALSEDIAGCQEAWAKQAAEIGIATSGDFKTGEEGDVASEHMTLDGAITAVNAYLDTESVISEGTLDVLVSKSTAARGLSEDEHKKIFEQVRDQLLVHAAKHDIDEKMRTTHFASKSALAEEVSILRDSAEIAARKNHRLEITDGECATWWQKTAARGRDLALRLAGVGDELGRRRDFVRSMMKQGLSREQARAAYDITRKDIGLEEGAAGVGKTFALKPVVDLYRARGYRMIGISTAWKTARSLQGAGIEEHETLAAAALIVKLDAAERKGQLDKLLPTNTILVVDELSMLGSREAAALLRHANAQQIKVVAIGDRSQLEAPGRGDAMRLMLKGLESTRGKLARVLTVVRQKSAVQKEIANSFRDGKDVRGGVEKLEKLGRFHITETRDAAGALIKGLFEKRMKYGAPPIVICPTNKDAVEVAGQIRDVRRAAGQIVGDDREIEAQNKNGKHRWDLKVASGDRLRLYHKFPEFGLYNGSSVVFRDRKDGKLIVELLDEKKDAPTGKIVTIDEKAMRDPVSGRLALTYADVATAHARQGATRRSAIGYLPRAGAADQKWAYVTGSRHEQEFDLVVAADGFDAEIRKKQKFRPDLDKAKLVDKVVETMSRKSSKILAIDLVGEPPGFEKPPTVAGALTARIAALRERAASWAPVEAFRKKVDGFFRSAGAGERAKRDRTENVSPVVDAATASRVDYANSQLAEMIRQAAERRKRRGLDARSPFKL